MEFVQNRISSQNCGTPISLKSYVIFEWPHSYQRKTQLRILAAQNVVYQLKFKDVEKFPLQYSEGILIIKYHRKNANEKHSNGKSG